MDHPKRTLLKTITWRIIALVTTIVIVYLYSGDFKKSCAVGLIANALKMLFYYGHERAWNRIHFGRTKPQDYQI
jgi:uncharacterized membrane protein